MPRRLKLRTAHAPGASPHSGKLVSFPGIATLLIVNVLLFALGSHGDVHPFVGIGIRMRERGHHVAVAANDYFKPLVEHAQLEFISLGTVEEYTALATSKELWSPLRGPQAVFEGTARYL